MYATQKNANRLLVFLLALLLIMPLSASVFAQTTATVTVGTNTADPGATGVTVPVSIAGNPGVVGLTMTVTYNEQVLTLTQIKTGAAMTAGGLQMMTPTTLQSGCTVAFFADTVSNVEDGEVMLLTFDVADTAVQGNYPVTVTVDEMVDNAVAEVTAVVNDGFVTVNPFVKGTPIGASIRVGNSVKTGIRFGVEIQKNDSFNKVCPSGYAFSDTVQFGTLLIPTSLIPNGKTLVEFFNDAKDTADEDLILNIPAEKIYAQTANTLTYTGVLHSIPEEKEYYTWEITAAFYLRTRNSSSDEWTYYFVEQSSARSLYDVANAMYQNEYSDWKIEEYEADDEKYSDETMAGIREIAALLYDIVSVSDGGGWITPDIWY